MWNYNTTDTPTRDDCTMAVLAHALAFLTGFVGPLILYFVKRDQSRFAAFHAMQAALWQVALGVVMGGAAVLFLGALAVNAAGHPDGPEGATVVLGVIVAVIWAGLSLADLILCIYFGVKANNGEWVEYPVLGRVARNMVGA